jgi:hypothetical protein
MGARESRSQQEAGDDGGDTASQDYYAILEVDENASADEIRVSPMEFLARSSSNCCGMHPFVRWGVLYFIFIFF